MAATPGAKHPAQPSALHPAAPDERRLLGLYRALAPADRAYLIRFAEAMRQTSHPHA